jgi:hypothetical protein
MDYHTAIHKQLETAAKALERTAKLPHEMAATVAAKNSVRDPQQQNVTPARLESEK